MEQKDERHKETTATFFIVVLLGIWGVGVVCLLGMLQRLFGG